LLLITQYKLWFGNYGVTKLNHLRSELHERRTENDDLIRRNEALHAQVQELKAGKEALEEHARSHMGMIKDGEIFIQEIKPSKQ